MSTLLSEPASVSGLPAPAGEFRVRSLTADPAQRPTLEDSPKRILYVDDDRSFRRFGELVLLRSGHCVQTAQDGAEAWAAVQHQSFHLVITDNQMPRLTGLELIHKLRRARIDVPIILASSTVNEIPWPDCSAMLAKPFTVEQLRATVRRVLRAAGDGISGPLLRACFAPSDVHLYDLPIPGQSGMNQTDGERPGRE